MAVDIKVLKQLYESGYSLQECCEATGLKSAGSLLKRFRNNQIPIRTLAESTEKYKLILPTAKVIKMYQAGLSCNDIALEFGCSRQSINKYLVANGVKLRSLPDAVALSMGSLLNPDSRKLILKLRFVDGLNSREIERRTGINREVVKRFCWINAKSSSPQCSSVRGAHL